MEETGLTCIICEEYFSDEKVPRNLKCGHSLCTPCIDHVITMEYERRCPECREPMYINGSSELSVNYPLLRLARSVSKSSVCQYDKKGTSGSLKTPSVTNADDLANRIFIDDFGSGPMWKANPAEFTCRVTSPKKQSKYNGIKHFVEYSVIPSFTSKRVMRSYEQFLWLKIQLTERYPLILVPSLPDKRTMGQLKDEVIESQRQMLQTWIDRICRHPVLSLSEVFHVFVLTSNKESWKNIKIKCKNDRLMNENFFNRIQLPHSTLDMDQVELKFVEHEHFTNKLENAMKSLRALCYSQSSTCRASRRQEHERVSKTFRKMGRAFDADVTNYIQELPSIFYHLSEAYSDIAKLYAKEARSDWSSLHSLILQYEGLLGRFTKIKSVSKKITSKWSNKDYENVGEQLDDKSTYSDLYKTRDITTASESILAAFAFQAEAAHFHQERTRDFKKSIKNFLECQVEVHQRITDRLQECLSKAFSEEPAVKMRRENNPSPYKRRENNPSPYKRREMVKSSLYPSKVVMENSPPDYDKCRIAASAPPLEDYERYD